MQDDKKKTDKKFEKPEEGQAIAKLRGMVDKAKPGGMPSNEESVSVRAPKTAKARAATGDVAWLKTFFKGETMEGKAGNTRVDMDLDYDTDEGDNSFIWVVRAMHDDVITVDEYEEVLRAFGNAQF